MTTQQYTPDKAKIPRDLQGCDWNEMKPGITEFYDGQTILAAVPVCLDSSKPSVYEFSVLDISCDETFFAVKCQGEAWGWDINDIEFFAWISQ